MAVSCQQRDCARGLCLLGGDSIQGTVSFHALFKYNRIRIEPIYNNEVEILWRKLSSEVIFELHFYARNFHFDIDGFKNTSDDQKI